MSAVTLAEAMCIRGGDCGLNSLPLKITPEGPLVNLPLVNLAR